MVISCFNESRSRYDCYSNVRRDTSHLTIIVAQPLLTIMGIVLMVRRLARKSNLHARGRYFMSPAKDTLGNQKGMIKVKFFRSHQVKISTTLTTRCFRVLTKNTVFTVS